MRNPHVRLISLLACGWLGACGLGKSTPPWDDADDPGHIPERSSSVTTTPEAPRLSYAEIPGSTCASHIAVVGTAEPSSDVIVRGGDGGSFRASAASSGQFCVPVTLSPNQENKFEIRAFNELGFGEMVPLSVQHSCAQHMGTGPDGTMLPTVPTNATGNRTNVALGATVTSKYPARRGSLTAITDGNHSSFAEFGSDEWAFIPNPFCLPNGSWDGWVMASLDTLREIEQIKIVWRDRKRSDVNLAPSQKMWGMRYILWVSRELGTPSEPNDADGQWTKIRHVTDGDGGVDEDFRFATPLLARHIAITLELDGHCLPWGLNNILHWWELSWQEHFALAEIEAYAGASRPTSTPPPNEDVCLRASGMY